MWHDISFSISVLAIFFVANVASDFTNVVQITTGPVQGEILKTKFNSVEYASFKGIPYAEPPFGPLRFKPPVAIGKWTETLKATNEGPVCIQYDYMSEALAGSEDCLYLNVYTPKTSLDENPEEPIPVMVWIYGGSFKVGFSDSSVYGPDFFMETGVVLVTFNYRLGAFGFLSAGISDASGNAALKDQLLVLKWVQANIAKFGGNPKKVTLFGQSAGSISIALHELSKQSRGLFHHSITMSGSPLCPWAFYPPSVAAARAVQLGAQLGHVGTSVQKLVDFLRTVPAEDIVRQTENLAFIDLPFRPTVEVDSSSAEPFITECPFDLYKRGEFVKIPRMMGFVAHEFLLFIPDSDVLLLTINKHYQNIRNFSENSILKYAGAHYWLSPPAKLVKALAYKAFYTIIDRAADFLFIAGIDLHQRILSKKNPYPIWYYRLSYDPPERYILHRTAFNISVNGTTHGDDCGYMFHTSILSEPTAPDHPYNIFRMKFVRLWTNFAKYGNPTPIGEKDSSLNVTWPDSRKSGRMVNIDNKITVQDRLISPTARVLQFPLKLFERIFTGCYNTIFQYLILLL